MDFEIPDKDETCERQFKELCNTYRPLKICFKIHDDSSSDESKIFLTKSVLESLVPFKTILKIVVGKFKVPCKKIHFGSLKKISISKYPVKYPLEFTLETQKNPL